MHSSMEEKENSSLFSDHIPYLPPGFRFHPSDEELILHYLQNKATDSPLPASIITEIDLYKYDPWELPKKAVFGEEEWYFFSPRDRKYPNGARPNRAAASGYWKATGTDKPILASSGNQSIGVKKALVFYQGRPLKGIKTDWIMQEYRLIDALTQTPRKQKGSMRLDDWVLCRVRKRIGFPARNDVNQLYPSNPNRDYEIIKSSYLYNDCPMLPYMFSSPELPCNVMSSSVSLERSPKSVVSVANQNGVQLPVSFETFFNPLKRKLMSQSCDNLPTKKFVDADAITYCTSDINIHSEGNYSFGYDQCKSVSQYQELYHLD